MPVETAERPASMAALIDSMMDAPPEAPEAPVAAPEPQTAPEPATAPVEAPAAAPKLPVAPSSPDIPPDDIITPSAPKAPEIPADDLFAKEPEGLSKKGKVDWDKLREAHYKTLSRMSEMEKKLQTPAPQPDETAQARIAELEQQLQQLSPIVERNYTEQHPLFIKEFEMPKQQLMAEAQSVMQMADIDPADFAGVLQSSGKARINAIDELSETITSPTLRNRLTQIGAELERIDGRRSEALKNNKMWKEQADASMKADQHRQMQQQKDHWSKVLDATVDSMAPQFEFLRESEGNPEWNKKVAGYRQMAKHLLTENTDPQQVATAAVLAPLALPYRAWALSEREGRLRAEQELATLKGSQSSLHDGTGETREPENGDRPLGEIFGQLYKDLDRT